MTGVNHKAGTMRVILEAKPKEYKEGMEAEVVFFDDGGEYTYSIEEGALNAKTGRYDASRKWVDDDINGGNLVIE